MHCEFNIKQPFGEGDVFGRLTPPPEEFIEMENEFLFVKPREQQRISDSDNMETEPSLMLDLEFESICAGEFDGYKTGPTLAELNETRSRSPLINPEMKRLHQAAIQTEVKQSKEELSQSAHILQNRSQSVLERQLRTQPGVSFCQEQFYPSQNKSTVQLSSTVKPSTPVQCTVSHPSLQVKTDHPYLTAALQEKKPVVQNYPTQAVSPQIVSPRLANNSFPVSRGKYCENSGSSCAVTSPSESPEEVVLQAGNQTESGPEQSHSVKEDCEHYEVSEDDEFDTEDEVDETDDYCPYDKGMKSTPTRRKGRKSESEDFIPNPIKLFNIMRELDRLNKIIKDLKPINEMPQHSRGKSRKEKNKLASRACRLKKKKQHESNKVKLHGLECEQENLTCIVKDMKNEIGTWASLHPKPSSHLLNDKMKEMERKALVQQVAGHTQEFVRKVLKEVAKGNKTGGLKLPPPT